MSSQRTIHLLCAEADRSALQPILKELSAKGLRVLRSKTAVSGKDTVLAVLSGTFYADEELCKTLLELVGAGADRVLPLKIDDALVPEKIMNALYARNILMASEREPGLVAERIISALPKAKNALAPLLITAGVLVLGAVGFLIWKNLPPAEEPTEEVTTEVEETQEALPIPAGLGVTEEELARITEVVICGEYFGYAMDNAPGAMNVYNTWENNQPHWYSTEDGREYHMTHYEDLRFLSRMPQLRSLLIALVDIDDDKLPDLGGMFENGSLWICDSAFTSLEWLAGSGITSLLYNRSAITDFSPLTRCESLTDIRLDYTGAHEADLAQFAPPALERLSISGAIEVQGAFDLTGLGACPQLKEFTIRYTSPLTSLDFLYGVPSLETLVIEDEETLQDIQALAKLKNLRTLTISNCMFITDYSPIGGCEALESLCLKGHENYPDALTDVGFLGDLAHLQNIQLLGFNLQSLNFLQGLADHVPEEGLSLAFSGEIPDYSGLLYVRNYNDLHINPRDQRDERGGDFLAVYRYILGAQIRHLTLYSCRDVPLSGLPDGISVLEIYGGDLRSLSGLRDYPLESLSLQHCHFLGSLNGLQYLTVLQIEAPDAEEPTGEGPAEEPGAEGPPSEEPAEPGAEEPTAEAPAGEEPTEELLMTLEIIDCPRLTDYTALDGAKLAALSLQEQYELPSLEHITTQVLHLENIPDLTDLSLLEALPEETQLVVELVGLEQIEDLSPLRRVVTGSLVIPPQLEPQAQELLEDGLIDGYEVQYPEHAWEPLTAEIKLLDLAELDTLPRALLERVERVMIVGNFVVDPDLYTVTLDWNTMDERGWPKIQLTALDTGVNLWLDPGTVTDLSIFAKLPNLRELRLYDQPLETLNGIQALSKLEHFEAVHCEKLVDSNAILAMQGLRELSLAYTGLSTVGGIPNLKELRRLNIAGTGVRDLRPLLELSQLRFLTVSTDMQRAIRSLKDAEIHFGIEIEGPDQEEPGF